MRRPGHDSRGNLLTPKKQPALKGGPKGGAMQTMPSVPMPEPEPEQMEEAWQTQKGGKGAKSSPGLPQSSALRGDSLRDWAEAVTVSVTGFESMTERDAAQPWTSWDTFFCVQYASTPASGDVHNYGLHFSRHMMSEFCFLHAKLAALDDEVKALPGAPRAMRAGHSEQEAKGRQEELDKWLRSVVWALAPKLGDPRLASVLHSFLCGFGSGETPMDDCVRSSTSFAIPCGGLRPHGGPALPNLLAAAEVTAQPARKPEPEPEPEPLASDVARHVSDEEDEIECRICRMEGEDDWPVSSTREMHYILMSRASFDWLLVITAILPLQVQRQHEVGAPGLLADLDAAQQNHELRALQAPVRFHADLLTRCPKGAPRARGKHTSTPPECIYTPQPHLYFQGDL